MIRIICTECKNAYLNDEGDMLVCPSCEKTYSQEMKNLLLGVQYYNEGDFSEADNYFMKHIVKNSTNGIAIFYKALCDAQNLDEDTLSLKDTYKKIFNAFDDVSDEDYPCLIALANDETEKIEKALTEIHVRLFADADAEKIKKQVEIILNIQKEAKAFRVALNDLVIAFNERSDKKISAKFSDCFFVEKELAEEVGNIKYEKICDNIATHTVFKGILTSDIKNLEIYLRCVVMFFQKSYDKYKFLLEQSSKFEKLAEVLELGRYNTITGTAAVADKLRAVSYEFLQDSYKEHFDEKIDMQTETVVVLEPEAVEEEPVYEEVSQETEKTEETETAQEELNEENTEEAKVADTGTEKTETEEVPEIEEEITTPQTTEDKNASEISEEVQADVTEVTETETDTEETNNECDEETIEVNSDIIEIEIDEPIEEIEETEIENISSTTEIEDKKTKEEIQITEEEQVEYDTVVEIPVDSKDETDITEAPAENATENIVTTEESAPETFEKIEADEAVINGDDQKHKRIPEKKKKGHKALILFVLIIVLAGVLAVSEHAPEYINKYKYDNAVTLAQDGKYTEAVTAFKELGEYSDSAEKALECEYNYAVKLEEDGKFAEAKLIFGKLGDYADSETRAQACGYSEAQQTLENNNFEEAKRLFTDLGDYGNSKEMIKECSYKHALSLMENKKYKDAIEILTAIRKYSDAKEKILEAKYMFVTDNFDKKNKTTVKYLNELTTAEYRNSADLRKELLGSAEVMSENIKAFVNYSSTDLETSLTQLENTRSIYFHVVVGDKALYGQTLTLKYTTAFGYSQKQTVVLSESDNVAVMSYPSTPHKNYTVDFELFDSTGKKVAGQQISF